MNETLKRCEYCGGLNRLLATKCEHCGGNWFADPPLPRGMLHLGNVRLASDLGLSGLGSYSLEGWTYPTLYEGLP